MLAGVETVVLMRVRCRAVSVVEHPAGVLAVRQREFLLVVVASGGSTGGGEGGYPPP